MALETRDGRTHCGLVRNPLGYLFKAQHPDADVTGLEAAPELAAGHDLSVKFASALGLGRGCDAEDDEESAAWGVATES